MPSKEELKEAYLAFRLPVGSDWRTIKKRYKLLVKAWHPDKQGGEVKEEVEQELKEYNHFYNDVFKVHFDSEHADEPGCVCQPTEEVHEEHIASEEPVYQSEQSDSTEQEFVDPEVEALSQKRRWQASGLCALVFIAILAYGFIGSKIKSILPVPSANVPVNSITPSTPSSSSTSQSSSNPPAWRAQYQSITGPITKTQSTSLQVPSDGNADDVRRRIVEKQSRMQLLQQSIETLKAQIKIAQPASAGMLYRDLGSKEAEMRNLQQDVYNLETQLAK